MKLNFSKISGSILLALFISLLNIRNAHGQAINDSCGPANIHNPQVNYWQVRDIDGNNIKAVVIGEQVWFAENLKVTRFQNGDPIYEAKTKEQWEKAGQNKKAK